MSADIAPLAAMAPHAARWDIASALAVMVLTPFMHFFSDPVRVAALAVMLITLWEKPTVQAFVARVRARFNRKDDDALG